MSKSRSKTGHPDLLTRLTKLAGIYKPVLRLEDWDIKLQVSDEIPDNAQLADVYYHSKYPRAVITLYNPDNWAGTDATIDEINKTVLHEFLHITLCPLNRTVRKLHGDSDAVYDATEYVVEDLERVIYPLIKPILQKAKLT